MAGSSCDVSYRTSFVLMMCLTLMFFGAKIVVGYMENSIALVADSFHLISDMASLVVGLVAVRIAAGKVKGGYTFGYVRAEVLGGLINAIFLVALCFSITVESTKRLLVTEKIDNPMPVLIVGSLALVTNIIGLVLFRNKRQSFTCKDNHIKYERNEIKGEREDGNEAESRSLKESDSSDSSQDLSYRWDAAISAPHELNIRGVYLHILQHVLSAFIIVLNALVVLLFKADWTSYIDPSISIIVVLIILQSVLPLLKESLVTFMQGLPADLQIQAIEERLMKTIPNVIGVHEFHVWQLAGKKVVASAHIVFRSPNDYREAAKRIRDFFCREGLHGITCQPEFADSMSTIEQFQRNVKSNDDCLLACTGRDRCNSRTCCGEIKGKDNKGIPESIDEDNEFMFQSVTTF